MNVLDVLLDSIDEALIILDSEGKIMLFNQQANDMYEMMGWPSLVVEQSIYNILPAEAYHKVSESILDLKLRKSPVKVFSDRIAADGNRVYLETTYLPVQQDGVITHIYVLVRDVTMNKVFENRLTTIATNLTNLIERANAVIIGIDSRGYITDWNRHCTDVLGYTKTQAFTQKLSDFLLDEESRPRLEEVVLAALQNKSTRNFELQVTSEAGDKLVLLLSASPRATNTGQVIGVIFVGQNITELTVYRESLEKMVEQRTRELTNALEKEKEALNLRSRFVSMVSHEFRTPLSSISFATGYLKKFKDKLTPDAIDDKLGHIQQQVSHMTNMMEDILTIGRSEARAEAVQASLSQIDVEKFLHDLADDIYQATHQTHTIHRNFSFQERCTMTDEKLLRNIFINLLTNAIKFSPGCKDVWLVGRSDEMCYVIEVRDGGIGIPTDELSRIFEPFHRSDQVGSIPGAGLGLSIVKRAVEILKGTLTVTSTPGAGTTFTVTLPCAYESQYITD
jgi:PAS domain S-box-containing protein